MRGRPALSMRHSSEAVEADSGAIFCERLHIRVHLAQLQGISPTASARIYGASTIMSYDYLKLIGSKYRELSDFSS